MEAGRGRAVFHRCLRYLRCEGWMHGGREPRGGCGGGGAVLEGWRERGQEREIKREGEREGERLRQMGEGW